jgi:hypothetical protein
MLKVLLIKSVLAIAKPLEALSKRTATMPFVLSISTIDLTGSENMVYFSNTKSLSLLKRL